MKFYYSIVILHSHQFHIEQRRDDLNSGNSFANNSYSTQWMVWHRALQYAVVNTFVLIG